MAKQSKKADSQHVRMAKQSKKADSQHVRKETFWLVTLLALAVGFFGGVMFGVFKSDTAAVPGRPATAPAPAKAEVFSFTVIHHASHAAVADNLPYVVGLVTFPGLPGVKLVTNITDIPPSDIRIGMPLTLWWDDIGDGMHLPRFRPA